MWERIPFSQHLHLASRCSYSLPGLRASLNSHPRTKSYISLIRAVPENSLSLSTLNMPPVHPLIGTSLHHIKPYTASTVIDPMYTNPYLLYILKISSSPHTYTNLNLLSAPTSIRLPHIRRRLNAWDKLESDIYQTRNSN